MPWISYKRKLRRENILALFLHGNGSTCRGRWQHCEGFPHCKILLHLHNSLTTSEQLSFFLSNTRDAECPTETWAYPMAFLNDIYTPQPPRSHPRHTNFHRLRRCLHLFLQQNTIPQTKGLHFETWEIPPWQYHRISFHGLRNTHFFAPNTGNRRYWFHTLVFQSLLLSGESKRLLPMNPKDRSLDCWYKNEDDINWLALQNRSNDAVWCPCGYIWPQRA